jgi:ribosome modulation factor
MAVFKPFAQGLSAFEAGVAREACPYAEGSPQRQAWEEGWDYGERLLNTPKDKPR